MRKHIFQDQVMIDTLKTNVGLGHFKLANGVKMTVEGLKCENETFHNVRYVPFIVSNMTIKTTSLMVNGVGKDVQRESFGVATTEK